MKERILVVVAHSDDQVLGPGGSIRKYVLEGAEVKTVIFSYGELSHPHFKREVIKKIRVEEALRTDKFLGGSGVTFFGLREGKFKEEFMPEELEKIFLSFKPTKIFTHANDESHADHVAVHNFVVGLYDTLHAKNGFTADVYSFGIWRFFQTKEREAPRLVVDISKTFTDKLKALNYFKSQKVALFALKWSVYVKAFFAGLRYHVQFAEVFNKVR